MKGIIWKFTIGYTILCSFASLDMWVEAAEPENKWATVGYAEILGPIYLVGLLLSLFASFYLIKPSSELGKIKWIFLSIIWGNIGISLFLFIAALSR